MLAKDERYSKEVISEIDKAEKIIKPFNTLLDEAERLNDLQPEDVGAEAYLKAMEKKKLIDLKIRVGQKDVVKTFVDLVSLCNKDMSKCVREKMKAYNNAVDDITKKFMDLGCNNRYFAGEFIMKHFDIPVKKEISSSSSFSEKLKDLKFKYQKILKGLEIENEV